MSAARSRLVVAVLVLAVLLILLLAAGPSALAGPKGLIVDLNALPSWTSLVAGPAAGNDTAADVVLLKNGVTLVCGNLTNAAGNTDISVTKYKNGVLKWTKAWNGPANGADTVTTTSPARKIVASPDGKYVYVCGQGTRAGGNIDIYVLKRRVSDGKLIWARRYDGRAHKNDLATAIGIDLKGNIVVSGVSVNAADSEYAVVSWKPSGALRWSWRWNGKGGLDVPFDLLVTSAGDSYVTGVSTVTAAKLQAVTAHLSAAGKKLWLKKWQGSAALGAAMSSLAPGPRGGVYAGGWTTSAVTANDAVIIKYSKKGARSVLAVDSAGGGGNDQMFWDIAVLSTRDVVGVGSSEIGANLQPLVSVFTPGGAMTFQGIRPTFGSDTFAACAADKFGGWYATATIHDTATSTKIWTYRSSVLSQAGLWSSQVGDANTDSAARNIAVRDSSCTVVGQSPSGGPSGIDQIVLTYNY